MIVGIDLGTTNSLIAVWIDGKAQLIPNALGENLTPSAISIDKDGSFLVGRAAKMRLQSHPESSVALFKRTMGTDKIYTLDGRKFRSEELSALIISSLKKDAEHYLGKDVQEAIISVPAYFSDTQRKATRAAGEIAGLKIDCLINEPTAAALSHGIQDIQAESQFLVFDLGGGTFDVSLLELFEGVMEVRASAGDNHLGGEDFLNILIEKIANQAKFPNQLKKDKYFLQHLRTLANHLMHQMSEQKMVESCLNWEQEKYPLSFTRQEFESLAQPLLDRLMAPVESALRDSRIRASELDAVILAGGATRMPMIRNLVTKMFGRFPTTDHNPDEAIAIGCAIQAGLKADDQALREVVMTDVCPYTLSTEVVRYINGKEVYGFATPVIERNTVIPASRSIQLFPLSEEQRVLSIAIYQGEARLVKNNILLGKLDIKFPKGKTIAEKEVSLRYTYDVDGLLEVDVTILETGEKKILVIENNPGILSSSEILERLKAFEKLKIHPREKIVNRTLIAEAESVYLQLKGDLREHLAIETGRFEMVLDRQDEKEIREAVKDFKALLESIRSNSYLDL